MSERVWRPTGRAADALSLLQWVWDRLLPWLGIGGLTALFRVPFEAVQPIADLGWGAVVLASVAAACLASLAVTGSLALFRVFRPVPSLPQPPSAPAPPAPASIGTAGRDETADLKRRLAALERQIEGVEPAARRAEEAFRRNAAAYAKLEEARMAFYKRVQGELSDLRGDLGAAKAEADAAAAAAREEGAELRAAIRDGAEAARKEREASEARLTAEIAAADARAKDRLAALNDWAIDRLDKLQSAIAAAAEDAKARVEGTAAGFTLVTNGLGERVGELEAKAAAIEQHFHRLLRLRDAARRLRALFDELRPLADRLLLADKDEYPDGKAWRADYDAWHARLGEFWRIASAWDPPGVDPLALSADELDRVRVPADDARFADFELQRRRRLFVAAHLKHGQYAGEALARIEAEARGEPG